MTHGTVYLGLGSNLGSRSLYLEGAVHKLQAEPRFTLLRRAQVYESRALGARAGGSFLNTVVAGAWEGTPHELLDCCQAIELAFGRTRPYPDAPRTLDIDLLWWEGVELDTPALSLPHPRLHERAFALVPLLEIAGRLTCATTGVPLASSLSGALFSQGLEVASHPGPQTDFARV